MPCNPASRYKSPLIGGQWREDRSKVHFSPAIDLKPTTGHSASKRLPGPIYKEKPMDGQRLASIQRQNRLLEKRIEAVYNGKGLDNRNYLYDQNRAKHPTRCNVGHCMYDRDSVRFERINHTSIFRERQLLRTHKENMLLEKRLWDIKPFIRSDDWAKSYRNHERHAQLRGKPGYQVSPRATRRSIYSETPRSNNRSVVDASYC